MLFETPLAWVVGGIAALVLLRWLRPKARTGEQRVQRTLRRHLDQKEYLCLHDLTLPTPDGTTQIDHIVVSRFGIFVLETKELSGWIFGDERSRKWTQVLYNEKHRFQNPLHQNYKHLKAVEHLLGVEWRCLHSVVVFAGHGEFRTEMPRNVLYLRDLPTRIRSETRVLLSPPLVEDAFQALESHLTTSESRELHRANLELNKLHPLCPQCGASMVLRTAQRGREAGEQFWGCSEFPRCRAVKPKA